MTIRTQMRKKKLKLLIATWTGIALFISGMILGEKSEDIALFSFIGFAVFIVLLALYGYWAMRCPRCKGNLGHFLYYGPPFSVSKKLKYCPFCGVEIDSGLDEHNQVELAKQSNS
jgi:hypothetical protein